MSSQPPRAQTLREKYYAINAALNEYIKSKNVRCPVVKFGIDPATIKAESKDQTNSRYPYMQSFLLNAKPQGWTSYPGGIYTRFEYQLSFFTSPETEFENDSLAFLPYNLARLAFSDITQRVLLTVDNDTGSSVTIADVLSIREEHDFSMVSGAPVPKAVLIVSMAALCAYPTAVPPAGLSTNDLGIIPDYTFP